MHLRKAISLGLLIALIALAIGYQIGKHNATSIGLPVEAISRTRGTPRTILTGSFGNFSAKLDQVEDDAERFTKALASMEAWVTNDPEAALGWLSQQPITGRRNEVIRMALAQWSESSPKSAAEWSNNHLKGIELHNQMIRIAEQWAKMDAESAADWFSQLPQESRAAPLEGLFFSWGSRDHHAARKFLDTRLATDPSRQVYTQAWLAGWAKSAPAEASAQSLEISQSSNNPDLFANTLANWATVDLDASSSWLLSNVDPGPARQTAILEMAAMFAHQLPQVGLDWIGKLEASERTEAMGILGSEWARTDPEGAAEWLATQALKSLSEEARTSIMTSYLTSDETGFERWLNALPQGQLRTEATRLAQESYGGPEE